MSDIWDETVERIESESSSSIRKHRKQGYRDHRPLSDERRTQQGFNDGFREGLKYGRLCGQCYASLMDDISKQIDGVGAEILEGFKILEEQLIHGHMIPSSIDTEAIISKFSQRSQDLLGAILECRRPGQT